MRVVRHPTTKGRLRLRASRAGAAGAGVFVLAFLALLAWVFLVASKNPADSGESAILLLPFAMPWVMWLSEAWLGPVSGLMCVLLNATLIYLLFGGLRFAPAAGDSSGRGDAGEPYSDDGP